MTADTKACALPDCGKEIVRQSGRSEARWMQVRYCDSACAAKARPKPAGKSHKAGMVAVAEPAPVLRYEVVDGQAVWRPNAPGWPARPGERVRT